jgi:hypothetical protein
MSLPTYSSLPSYTAEPGSSERRIALNNPSRSRYRGYFIKQSRNGAVSLRLYRQANHINTPVYSREEVIRGAVELAKTDNITSVEVKVQRISLNLSLKISYFPVGHQLEGILQLQEIAEGGRSSSELCSTRLLLWTKGQQPCPPSLTFSSKLPATFSDDHGTYVRHPSCYLLRV